MHTDTAGGTAPPQPDVPRAPAPAPDLLQPLDPAQRIPALDVVRGFALLGILMMNIEFFTRPMQGMMLGFDASLAGADYVAGWLVMAFVQGKFWTLFSLLFGMGFAVMLERAPSGQPGFIGRYARRLLVLLAIGLAHALLVWPGDILVPYAATGFVLLLGFRGTPVSRLWKWGLALYLAPLLLMWAFAGGMAAAQLDPAFAETMARDLETERQTVLTAFEQAETTYSTGSYGEVTARRLADSLMQWSWFPMLVPTILGVFLLGAWFMRSGVMREPAAHRPLLRRLLWVGLPLGALLAVAAMPLVIGGDMIAPTPRLVLGMSIMTVANLLLSLGYMSALVLALLGPLPALRDWLAPVGRMALSNYLLQSLLFTTLFYGYGLGLWGQVPRAWQLALAVAFFLLQVVVSRWWMRHFRYGPAEWAWRAATYGKAPRMRPAGRVAG